MILMPDSQTRLGTNSGNDLASIERFHAPDSPRTGEFPDSQVKAYTTSQDFKTSLHRIGERFFREAIA